MGWKVTKLKQIEAIAEIKDTDNLNCPNLIFCSKDFNSFI